MPAVDGLLRPLAESTSAKVFSAPVTWPAEAAVRGEHHTPGGRGGQVIFVTNLDDDLRVVDSVRRGTGGHIDSQSEVGGWPTLDPGTPPADRDDDGMPDAWEAERGLDPDDDDDGNGDRNGDGYTNVEEYLNGLFDDPDPHGDAPARPRDLRIIE